MEGKENPPELQGIIPNAFRQIFDTIEMNDDPRKKFLVRVSYIEIYMEAVRDLLASDPKSKLNLVEVSVLANLTVSQPRVSGPQRWGESTWAQRSCCQDCDANWSFDDQRSLSTGSGIHGDEPGLFTLPLHLHCKHRNL